ncbi:amino acid adenylation domain-containing protein [Rossellomorea vietnamensis]|uniref:Amino acid adenylation domain-containing protein n=1 Tax=Rossellomorea vietnamensis TaxID=218284 RepID=A0A5D4NG82_9BACI|nr:non-ribosomal peptide synthetase [Rossellomorea vietnamensis]TYS12997.1 amino acid adenylation domain-containing protein [Rossellomorea vietnamensis]
MNKDLQYFPLSQPQMRIWYTEKFSGKTSIGNIAGTLLMKRSLDINLLEKAINKLFEKQSALRIRLTEEDGIPKQYISEYKYFAIEKKFFRDTQDLNNWAVEQAKIPFRLYENELVKIVIINFDNDSVGIFVKIHHIISDAWSMALIGDKILDYYFIYAEGGEINEPINDYSYIDYIKKEQAYLNTEKFIQSKKFWTEQFKTIPKDTQLFTGKITNNLKSERASFTFNKGTIKKVNKYCTDKNISFYSFFFTLLNLYIYRVSNEPDVTILTSIHNRNDIKDKSNIGMFISSLPTRVTISPNQEFSSFAKKSSKELVKFYRHQKYPFNSLVEDIRKIHRVSNVRISDVLLSYQNKKMMKQQFEKETIWYPNGHQEIPLSIHINDRDDIGELCLDFDYRLDVYSKLDIELLFDRLRTMIDSVISKESIKVDEIEILPSSEKEKVINEFNHTSDHKPACLSLVSIFEKTVDQSPGKIAVTTKNENLTYGELNIKANQLANFIINKGIEPDSVIALKCERSIDMMVGILGILKAGCAYLPVSPDFPTERTRYILHDSKVKLLVSSKPTNDFNSECESIVLSNASIITESNKNPETIINPESLAYVIYTSGSTGKPKGVMVEHSSVVNRINWMVNEYNYSDKDRFIQKTPFVFDVSVSEIFTFFFVGAKLYLLEDGEERDPLQLCEIINAEKISRIHFVPSMLTVFLETLLKDKELLQKCSSLRTVFTSGEPLKSNHILCFNSSLFNAHGTTISNLYGPTEATVEVSYFDCPPGVNLKNVPIGKPINNVQLYIVDKKDRPQPIGVVGELCISGDCLARGYIFNKDLTLEKFIDNPFEKDKKMYKTGDMARWLPEGNVEFLGRLDDQIKMRGYRIELGEIEAQLLAHSSITEAVVITKKGSGELKISAYIVAENQLKATNVRSYLKAKLPSYMIPSEIIFLDHLPLTINGKVDRKVLVNISNKQPVQFDEVVMAQSKNEKILSAIWSEVLDLETVGVNIDFTELGGNSLLAAKVVARINKQFKINMSLGAFFQNTSISQLSSWIDANKEMSIANSSIRRIDRTARQRK